MKALSRPVPAGWTGPVALTQFNKRLDRIERARTATEAEIAGMITAAIEREDA